MFSDMKLHDADLLERTKQHAVKFLEALPERFAGARATRDELLRALRIPLPDNGDDASTVVDALASQGDRGTLASAGPRYFGFVIGGALPVSLAADWLTSTWDQNCGLYATSPIASVVEDISKEWLLDVLDLPRESGVGFVTGCQMANFTCLASARHGVLRRAGWNVEEEGVAGAPRINILMSSEAHVTIHTSLRYLGLGLRSLHRVDADDQGRMRVDDLDRVLQSLPEGPTIICTQAGNVNSGAVDPIGEMCARAANGRPSPGRSAREDPQRRRAESGARPL